MAVSTFRKDIVVGSSKCAVRRRFGGLSSGGGDRKRRLRGCVAKAPAPAAIPTAALAVEATAAVA